PERRCDRCRPRRRGGRRRAGPGRPDAAGGLLLRRRRARGDGRRPGPGHREAPRPPGPGHGRHRPDRDQRGLRGPGAGVPGALRDRRRRRPGQPVGRRHRAGPPARLLRRAADDAAGPPVRRASRRPLRHHHHVRRHGHGRDRAAGEHEQGRERQVSSPIEEARELFAGEVVTKALARDVEHPYGAGKAVLITLDNGHDHTKPNTFGPGGLLSLGEAIDAAAARTDIAAVAITGKPFIFAVGADLTGVPLLQNREQAHAIGRLGHDVFRKLGELNVPTFAFVNGAAMGGGVEVALHCSYRTVSSGVPAFSLPEAFLGLVPGWGGTYLLPNLIGAEKALKVVIENPLAQNKQLKGPKVFEMGIADAIFEPADFVEESLRWAAKVVKGEIKVERPEVDKGEAWDQAVNNARFLLEGKLHGAAPAPVRALELVAAAKDRTRDEGFAAEDDALADLIMSDQLKAGLYAFDLVQKRAKRPAGAPDKSLARKVTKVGVVGAGLMAGQLALLFARRLDVPVVLTDLDQDRLDKGVGYVHGEIDKLLAKGRVNQDKANRLKGLVTGSLTKDAFADADFVIEAVFEKMEVKQQVFAEVEAVVSP